MEKCWICGGNVETENRPSRIISLDMMGHWRKLEKLLCDDCIRWISMDQNALDMLFLTMEDGIVYMEDLLQSRLKMLLVE